MTIFIIFIFFSRVFFPLEKGRNTAILGSTDFCSAVGPCRVMREKKGKVSTQKTPKIKIKLSPKASDTVKGSYHHNQPDLGQRKYML